MIFVKISSMHHLLLTKMTWKITSELSDEIFHCNHEEANTPIIFHAGLEALSDEIINQHAVVVVSKDTDVFMSIVYAYAFLQPTSE